MTDQPAWGKARNWFRHPGIPGGSGRRRVVQTGMAFVAPVVALLTGSCRSGDLGAGPELEVPGPPAFTAIISDAVAGGAGSSTPLSTAAGEVAYVSLSPGTVPLGEAATILNRRSGTVGQTLVINGGFDPVPVAARTGDTLRIEVRWQGAGLVAAEFSVPPRRPPVIVRTQPPPGKRDVPLNASLVVVFSEPIDPGTVTPVAIQLVGDDGPVPGTAQIVAGFPWMAEFVPATPLEAETTYELVVSQGIQDLDGESLTAGDRVPFTTGLAHSPPPPGNPLLARFRVVHADDEVSPFDVLVDGRLVARLEYMQASDYLELDPIPHDIEVISSSGWLESRLLDLAAGVDYTFIPCCALMGGFGNLLTYDRGAPAAGHARLRLVNYARQATADFYVTVPGADLAQAIPTARVNQLDASGFIDLPAGQYQVRVTRWDNKTVVVDGGILTLGDGEVRTAIALDRRAGGAGRLLVLRDRN